MAEKQNVTIKKAKLKDDLFLEAEYSEVVKDGSNTVKKDCTAPVHDDLKAAFRKLDIHLGILCQQCVLDQEGIEWEITEDNLDMDVKNITCRGFTIGGSGDSEGVTLIGFRILSNDKILNLVSPFQKWDDINAPYEFVNELGEIIEECKHEVKEYLFNDKHAPEAQLDLFEQDSQDNGEKDTLLK